MENKKPSPQAAPAVRSLVVTPAAVAAIKKARDAAQGEFGMRPDFSLVATALILEGAKSPNVNESIRNTVLQAFGLDNAVAAEAKPA